jgi:hypothetical protein
MAYIGNTAQNQAFTPAIDYFNGDGSTTAFTLSRPVASVAQVQAVIENVPQNPGDAFTVSGNTITFTSAPPSGTSNIYVYYTSPITTVIQPGQGTVGTAQIVDGAVTSAKLAAGAGSQWVTSGANISYTTGNVGIGTSSPIQKLDVSGSGDTRIRIASTDSNPVQLQLVTSHSSPNNNNWSVTSGSGGTRNLVFTDNLAAERMRIDSSGNLLFNSGYGSVATAYGCRAWVNFNGTGTVAIRASGNVSSITDNGVGNYTVNFTTAMPDINYSLAGTCGVDGAAESLGKITPAQNVSAFATGSIRIICTGNTTTLYDANPVSVQIFR